MDQVQSLLNLHKSNPGVNSELLYVEETKYVISQIFGQKFADFEKTVFFVFAVRILLLVKLCPQFIPRFILDIQGDQLNMVVFFWYSVDSDVSSEHYSAHVVH